MKTFDQLSAFDKLIAQAEALVICDRLHPNVDHRCCDAGCYSAPDANVFVFCVDAAIAELAKDNEEFPLMLFIAYLIIAAYALGHLNGGSHLRGDWAPNLVLAIFWPPLLLYVAMMCLNRATK